MDNPAGKWRALEIDGTTTHICQEKEQPKPQAQKPINTLTLEQLDQRLKKLEDLLLAVDMAK